MSLNRFALQLAEIGLLLSLAVSSCAPGTGDQEGEGSTEAAAVSSVPTPAPSPTPTLSAQDHYSRGLEHQDADEFEFSIHEFDIAIQINPNYVEAYFERGRSYALNWNYEMAIEDWSVVIELDPDNVRAYLFRAFAYDDMRDYASALADYDAVIHYDPQFATAYYWRGYAHAMVGDTEPAIVDLETALELGLDREREQEAQALLHDFQQLLEGEITFNGEWSGFTGQGENFMFTVEEGGIVAYGLGFQIPGCETLSPFYTFGGDPRAIVQDNGFSFEDHFASISGAFTSSETAAGTVEVYCQDGLSTTWIAWREGELIGTPSPDETSDVISPSTYEDQMAYGDHYPGQKGMCARSP